jgi:hypothetical protein
MSIIHDALKKAERERGPWSIPECAWRVAGGGGGSPLAC